MSSVTVEPKWAMQDIGNRQDECQSTIPTLVELKPYIQKMQKCIPKGGGPLISHFPPAEGNESSLAIPTPTLPNPTLSQT